MESGRTFNPWRLFVGAFLPNWLGARRELTPGAKLCYARLAQFAGREGVAYPSLDQLAAELGVSTRQVKRYVRELQTVTVDGQPSPLIAVSRRFRTKSNRITFLVHPWMMIDRPVEKLWRTQTEGPSASPREGTCVSPAYVEENQLKRITEGAGRSRARRPALPALRSGNDGVGGLVRQVSASLRMPGAHQPGLDRGELEAVRVRIETLDPEARGKLDRFAAWLRARGASDDELRAVVADLLARGDVENPYAYYAEESEARERIRSQLR